MKTHESAPDYTGYRFPLEIISHAVWLYFRFSLSFRDVEEWTTPSVGSWTRTKPYDSGVSNLGKTTPTN
jgi:hypothetical protein